jgi:TrmH family RNA methyltransferase
MKELSQTETTFDQMAVCKKLNQILQSDYILVLDDVQNPDNVGALIRSAVAFGFKHVVLSLKSADLYNEKTIRASQGAIFDCFVERRNIIDFLMEYSDKGYQLFGADAHQSANQPEANKPLVLVLGNEGNGLSQDVKELVDGLVQIKTETVESLNVVVAGSILMYEWGKRS